MVKGVAVNFSSYIDTIPKVLKLIKLDNEIKKHERIVIKVNLNLENSSKSTKIEFLEPIIQFCVTHKNPGSEIIIAEGCDGLETMELFDSLGYNQLAEKYGIGLVDLNQSACLEIQNPEFLRFESIYYPEILLNSLVITATPLTHDENLMVSSSLDSMLGAFPASRYRGFFARTKNKLNNYPLKYQVHDILKCKMPDLALIDASEKGIFIAGKPLDMDKQATKVLGFDWNRVPHIRLVDESFSPVKKEESVDNLIGKVPENK
ncbi:hypothetical protein EXS72_00930 [Candidatus Pacearchaeota archaeon]|nr:hypothetical protein [Candidatus Pacearchaeota archaeon]